MKYYVIINGNSSLDIQGLAIESLPNISKPLIRTTREEIDGRDGDVITKLGYSAYDKTLNIGLWGNYDINEVIAYFNEEGVITFSNEPDKYYKFHILNRIDFVNQLEKFKKASITIHCQPFKYKDQEAKVIEEEEHTTSGTSFNLSDTLEAPLEIDLKGNTEQDTLSGKNLCGFADGEQTINNVKATYTNGVINLKGTANATGFITINLLKTIPGGTYCLSANNTQTVGDSTNLTALRVNNEGGFQCALYNQNTYNSQVYNTNITYITIRIANGTVYNDFKITPQIEVGLNKTSYEQYCGGVPSPNPLYPQPINVVSGDNQIVVCGKNIYNYDNDTNYSHLYLDGSGNFQTDNTTNYVNEKINILSNTISIYIGSKSGTANIRLGQFKSDGTFISRTLINQTTNNITLDSECSYILLSSNKDTTTNYYFTNVSIIYGSSISSYIPYNGTTYNIDLPVENLFDKNNANVLNAYFNSTTPKISQDVGSRTIYIPCKPSTTYTISKIITNRFAIGYTTTTPALNVSVSGVIQNNSANAITITTGNNATHLVVLMWISTDTKTYNEVKDTIQIEYGSKANTRTPFGTTPIELNKIGTYQDYIYKENDKWYKHNAIGKYKLLSTDLLNISGKNATEGYIECSFPSKVNAATMYCNMLGVESLGATTDNSNKIGFTNISTNQRIRIRLNTGLLDLDDSKTMVNNNNYYFYYQIKPDEQTNTEITYTPLIEQLNTLEQAQSYDGTTNINQVNNDLPFIIDLTYYTGDTSITITNDGNIYSKPLLELKGTGNINIYLNGIQVFVVSLNNEIIYIDTDKMEAYYQGTLKNRQVVGDYNNFKLQSGNNTIQVDGGYVEYLKITNYSRWV